MARFKIDLDEETHARLVAVAARWKRPIDWQAEIELRRAMGLDCAEYDRGATGETWWPEDHYAD